MQARNMDSAKLNRNKQSKNIAIVIFTLQWVITEKHLQQIPK